MSSRPRRMSAPVQLLFDLTRGLGISAIAGYLAAPDGNQETMPRGESMKRLTVSLLLCALAFMPAPARAETGMLRIPLGAGGFGFLPLHLMKKHQLIEKKAAEAGLTLT